MDVCNFERSPSGGDVAERLRGPAANRSRMYLLTGTLTPALSQRERGPERGGENVDAERVPERVGDREALPCHHSIPSPLGERARVRGLRLRFANLVA